MRDDVRPELGKGFRCVADHFEFHRSEYEGRIAVIDRVARGVGVPVIDARKAYLALEPRALVSYFRDYCHQNADGNRFLARVIQDDLVRAAALPPADVP